MSSPPDGSERRRFNRRTEDQRARPMRPMEQRRHLRHDERVRVRIFRRSGGKDKAFDFSAFMRTADISSGGVFLESSFFLRAGLAVELEFGWPGVDQTIHVAGEVVRLVGEELAKRLRKPAGFAIRFTRFYGKSEIFLRAHLAPGGLHDFIAAFMKAELRERDRPTVEQLAELVVRWEIYQESLKP